MFKFRVEDNSLYFILDILKIQILFETLSIHKYTNFEIDFFNKFYLNFEVNVNEITFAYYSHIKECLLIYNTNTKKFKNIFKKYE